MTTEKKKLTRMKFNLHELKFYPVIKEDKKVKENKHTKNDPFFNLKGILFIVVNIRYTHLSNLSIGEV